jgi:hypothetical protein
MAFYEEPFGWQIDDLGFATMIRRPGYGDHLEATIDPGIGARQSGVAAPPGFEDAIAWVAPPPRESRRAGTSRSPWPTGTRRRLTQSDSARKSLGGTILSGRAPL